MTYIYLSFVGLSLLVSWVAYAGKVHWFIKGAMLTFLILFGLFVEGHYRERLGAPIESLPPNGFIYVHHEVVADTILIWAWVEETGDRLYVIPFDQDTAEALAEAQQKGTDQQGSFVSDSEGTENDSDSSLIFDDWMGDYTGETKNAS